MSETTHRASRLALASLLTVSLIAQLFIGMSRADLTIANFFSFFTVLSNVLAVAMLVMLAGRPHLRASHGFALFRGGVTVYMTVTGLVYAVLLAPTGVDVGLTEPWVNWSLHIVGPLALALDWILYPSEPDLPQSALLMWLGFPAAYLAYSISRGALIDWYPYPFLDPSRTDGYGGVAMWSAIVLVAVLGFGYAFLWWTNRSTARPT